MGLRPVVQTAGAVSLTPVAQPRRSIGVDQSAITPKQPAITPKQPARAGGEFFTQPSEPTQRRYEALRAYLAEGLPAAEVAARYGYTTQALHSAVRDFRAGRRDFFVTARPGPKIAPAKQAAHARIIQLRAAGHSIDEIAAALTAERLSRSP
jgi:transposase-like protein